MHFIKKQTGTKIVDLHVHSFFSKGLKLFVWSESAEWDWVSFLENANPSGKVNRLVEIHVIILEKKQWLKTTMLFDFFEKSRRALI